VEQRYATGGNEPLEAHRDSERNQDMEPLFTQFKNPVTTRLRGAQVGPMLSRLTILTLYREGTELYELTTDSSQ
jgi:hypothetical protein